MGIMLKKTQSLQIGGKGTRRIAQRRRKAQTHSGKNKTLEKNLANQISEINKKLIALDDNNYDKFQIFLDEILKDYLNDIKRAFVNKSNGLRYSDINKQGTAFLYKNLFYPINETKIILKSEGHLF